MSKQIRSLAMRLNNFVASCFSQPRRQMRLPVVVRIKPNQSSRASQKAESLSIEGYTQDLSGSGLAFIVPMIRLGEHYLVGSQQALQIEIFLPEGKVQIEATSQRYEQLDEHSSVSQYLIGAKIVGIKDEDKFLLEDFLNQKSKQGISTILGFRSEISL
jgi:hypothetical protein